MSTLNRSDYNISHLGNTQGVDPLADNTTGDISAEDLRNALSDLRDSAAFRKVDPYVRYVVSSNVGGTANAIVLTLTNDYPEGSYSNAIPVRFPAKFDSTGDVNIKINTLASVGLYKEDQTRVSTGDLIQNSFYECVFNSDADGSGTDGFTLYEGIGGTTTASLAPEPVEISGTTYTITEAGTYVFTGTSACAVTLGTEDSSMYRESLFINVGTANCTVNATGTINGSDPFVIYPNTSYHFLYTGITGKEWSFI